MDKPRKGKKGKNSKAAIDRASRQICDAYESLYALENIGLKYEQSTFDVSAIYLSVQGLCNQVRSNYAKAADHIAHLRHPAVPFLRKAADSLDRVEFIMQMANKSTGDDESKQSRAFRATVGKAILAFTSESARWMERAEIALGQSGMLGWLQDLMHVEGLPRDGEAQFKMLDVQQAWIAHEVRGLNQERRAQVANFISEVKRQQQA